MIGKATRSTGISLNYGRDLRRRTKRYWPLLVLILIPLALVFTFNYAAYPGLRIVFMNYKPALGFERSKWVGWDIFEKVFRDRDFYRALRNSLVFNILSLVQSCCVTAEIACPAELVTIESLTGDQHAENTFEAPNTISPVTQTVNTGDICSYSFPAYSVTVLRFHKK